MEKPELTKIQQRQWQHDEGFHQDIHTLSKMERINHYALHFSKYVGRLSRDQPEEEREGQVEKTIADGLIVAFATANTLELDLYTELEETFGESFEEVTEWADFLDNTEEDMDVPEVREWLFNRLAMPTGEIANAVESLDHVESMNLREILDEELIQIISFLLVASNQLGLDPVELIEDRWETIEEESIN